MFFEYIPDLQIYGIHYDLITSIIAAMLVSKIEMTEEVKFGFSIFLLFVV